MPLFGANNRLPLLHIDKGLIWIEETIECINEFAPVYMNNTTLNGNKYFKEQVEKCMNNIFGLLTQPFIKKRMTKMNTLVLEFLMLHETRSTTQKKYFRVLIYAMYTIIDNYFCIDYLACH